MVFRVKNKNKNNNIKVDAEMFFCLMGAICIFMQFHRIQLVLCMHVIKSIARVQFYDVILIIFCAIQKIHK